MSETPSSLPTTTDRDSSRATKKRALTPRAHLANEVSALFAKPDREIHIPSSKSQKNLAAPPEIVANVQGSSAGAGSGEFHVYKASRRREYERLRLMDEEVKKEEEEKEFKARKEEMERLDREKTEKNRAKREKARLRKMKMKKGGKGGKDGDGEDAAGGGVGGGKKKLAPNAVASTKDSGEQDAEEYDAEPAAIEENGLVIQDDED